MTLVAGGAEHTYTVWGFMVEDTIQRAPAMVAELSFIMGMTFVTELLSLF